MSSDLLLSSSILCQILLIGTLIIRELVSKQKRNFVTILFYSVLIVFVYLQELAIWGTIQEKGSASIFNNWITYEGFSLACFLLTISAIVIFTINIYLTAFFAKKLRKKQLALKIKKRTELEKRTEAGKNKQLPQKNVYFPTQNLYSYVITSAILFFVTFSLVYLLGGIGLLTENLGTSVGGQTVLLIGLQIGKMPLFYKIVAKRKVGLWDWILFLISIFLTLINSRRLAITGILQYAVLYNYCIAEIKISRLLIFFALSLLFAIGYGSLREYTNFYDSFHLDNLYEFYSSLDFFKFFFEKNVEGFAGFGGIISEYLSRGIDFDFGLSNLKLIVQLLPNSIRSEYAGDFVNLIDSVYPYEGSVVPAGFEASFAHFSFFGIFMFSTILGFFPAFLNFKLWSNRQNRIEYMFVSLQGIVLISGQFWLFLFFSLGDLTTCLVYKLIIKMTQANNIFLEKLKK